MSSRACTPSDKVRSEEGLEHVAGVGRLWIVDPLDGTREFRQLERSDWAVHVALAVGGEAVVGAVALPALDLVVSTVEPPLLPALDDAEHPRVVVSRSRPPDVAYDVTEEIGGVMIPMGSAGAKIAAVILGAAEVYVHAGGQYEWDSCAPVAVADRRAACTPAASTDHRCATATPTRGSPTSSCAARSTRTAVLEVTTRQAKPYW